MVEMNAFGAIDKAILQVQRNCAPEHRSAPSLSSGYETKSHNRLKYAPTMCRQKTGISLFSVDKQFSVVDKKTYQLLFLSTVF